MDKKRVFYFGLILKFSSHGIKFTDQIQITEYDEEFEVSDDESVKNKRPIDPLLKRLYIRTNSQNYDRIRYFSKEQEREEIKNLEEDESRDFRDSKEGKITTILNYICL